MADNPFKPTVYPESGRGKRPFRWEVTIADPNLRIAKRGAADTYRGATYAADQGAQDAWTEMRETHRKRPRDPNQLAKSIVDIATGTVETAPETGFTKRARAGGQKGGPARSAVLTPQQRSEIARAAAEARWKKT